MPRVPRQVWLVSLAVAVIFIMAAAAPYAAKPAGQRLASSIINPIGPDVVLIRPRVLAGWAALVISGLLLLVFLYRRRLFIMLWTLGWGVTGLSMLLASRVYATETLGWLVYGLSQFLGIVSALLFVLSADAYRTRPRFRRRYVLILVPLNAWSTLAPLILQAAAVFAPGHLLIAGALLAAGAGHLLLLRQVRMLAAVTGAGLIALAFVNAWVAISLPSPDASGATKSPPISAVLYLITAGGMQLMTFEDMTNEFRRTNRRLEYAQDKLRGLVTTDPLTGCRNRRFFDEIIGRELKRHRRYGIPLSLLFVDIDRFKTINDTYLGHDVGDDVLKHVASFLLANIREATTSSAGRRRVPGPDFLSRGRGAQARRRPGDCLHRIARCEGDARRSSPEHRLRRSPRRCG